MKDSIKKIWNLPEIQQIPETCDARDFKQDGLNAIFYDNVPYKGKKTKAFAWYGFPEGASAENPVPGMVLVHGGGGTAFSDWCRHWIDLGYAVIAMDNCGGVPARSASQHYALQWPRHDYSGPAGWGNIAQSEEPPQDQWIYHAVCSVLRAKELLASFPQVQKDNIGINGISWGAVISCITIGLDSSFRYAISVYGCGGFNTPESSINKNKVADDLQNRWYELWDPNHYLPETTVPCFFLVGAGDISFPTGPWFSSTCLPKGKVFRSLRPDYPHDHTVSWKSKTLVDFAKSFTENGTLPEFCSIERNGDKIIGKYTSGNRKIVSAQIFFTRATGAWMDRKWSNFPAEIQGNIISAVIPPLTTVCYLGMTDEKGCFWSSELIQG